MPELIVRDESRQKEERVLYKPGPSFTIYRESEYGDGRVLMAVASEIDDGKTAVLFAAAPDLLEACKEIKAEISNCIEFINDRTPSTDQQTISKLYSKLGKLIDKAEGRE